MCILKIINDESEIFIAKMKSLTMSKEENSLILKLLTEDSEIIYKIITDTRTPDISQIEKFINSELEKEHYGKKSFTVSEFLQRQYIYIGDDESKQFTAYKI